MGGQGETKMKKTTGIIVVFMFYVLGLLLGGCNIHKHTWIKIKETHSKPYNLRNFSGRGINFIAVVERAGFGTTTLLWECFTCQKIRKEEMLGK